MINVISLTQSLIRCRSVTPEDDGAQQILKDVLSDMGFEIWDLPFEGSGSYPVSNFFARLGDKGPHICFAGHTDVVPPGDESAWSSPPFDADIVDGKLIGRGASDMKGNICAFVSAVSGFLGEHSDFDGSVSFLITGDEEGEAVNGTRRVLEWMQENGHVPDVCLVGEPTNPERLGQEVKIGRRGCLTGHLTVDGKQGHVAYPHLADNPMPRLLKMLQALDAYAFDQGSDYFAPTNLEITTVDVGNTADNVIPGRAAATFNIRFSDHWQGKTLETNVREILDSVSSGYSLETRLGAESFLTTPGEWTNLVHKAVQEFTGEKTAMTTAGGTSDARFVCAYCPVVEFGLVNKTVHQIDEHILTDDLKKLQDIYQDILKRYFCF